MHSLSSIHEHSVTILHPLRVQLIRYSYLSQKTLNLYVFSDADRAGWSRFLMLHSGYCMFVGSNCVSWNAKKQSTVARSSAEANYRSMAVAALELTWIVSFLHDTNVFLRTPPILFVIILVPYISPPILYLMHEKTYRNRLSFCSREDG